MRVAAKNQKSASLHKNINAFNKKAALYCSAIFLSLCVLNGAASRTLPIEKAKLETQIEQALDAFVTPGMSVGVVKDGEVVLAKGFGFADIESKLAVDENTYFRLASTSKAFTAAALAVLVDQEKINWDDKVTDYLPDFELYDPYVTHEFTLLDLLTHRSGLVSGAGDSMIWPEPSGFTREEVIHNLRYLSPEYSFRSRYAYSNVLYITAGEIVAKVSGMSFDDFVEKNIFRPLNMNCFVGDIPAVNLKNVAKAYGHNDERGIYEIPRNGISQSGLMSAAAGGMVCNADAMNKWMLALLQQDNLPFSNKQLDIMWSPHTILGVSSIEKEWDNTIFKNYGLGWRLANIGGLRVISHTGTLSGYQAYVVLIPKLSLGVVVLNNGSHSGARGSVMQTILKAYLTDAGHLRKSRPNEISQENVDWIKTYISYYDEREQAYLARNIQDPTPMAEMSISTDDIIGVYEDEWFGRLIITEEDQGIRIHSSRMSTLKGSLEPFQDTSFRIIWDNQNAAGDAFMHFSINVKRAVTSAKLHPFSTRELSNHAYRDMHFLRVNE